MLEVIEVNNNDLYDTVVIWMHGLGATASDFVEMPDILSHHNFDISKIKFIFPQAPNRPITINNGYAMPGWYDIYSLENRDREDVVGIKDSAKLIIQLIEKESQNGIPYERIFIGGFSQGGAMSLYVGTRFKYKLAGIIGFSCYLLSQESLSLEQSAANKTTNILLTHGLFDPVLPLVMGNDANDKLTNLNYNVLYKTFPIENTVVLDEFQLLGKFFEDNNIR